MFGSFVRVNFKVRRFFLGEFELRNERWKMGGCWMFERGWMRYGVDEGMV